MRAIDISGQRFGILTVIGGGGADGYSRRAWLTQCDCGNKKVVSSNNLRTGNTKSCGCLKNEPRRREDLTGKRFGRLIVASYANTTNGRAYWQCRCDCGNVSTVSALKLKRGVTKSCGCFRDDVLRRMRGPIIGIGKWARTVKVSQPECAKCGSGASLHAHHIYPASTYKHIERDVSNGISLCFRCHADFHAAYGKSGHGVKEISMFLGLDELTESALNSFVGWRANGGKADVEKAIHFCKLIIELQYGEGR